PIAMGIISRTFPSNEKGRALGIWGAGVLIGPILGPPLGGVLTNLIGWRAIFLVNLPIGIVGVVSAYFILRREVAKKIDWSCFDFTGFALFSGFLTTLLYGASREETGGFGASGVFLCGFLSMIFLLSFLISE